MRFAGLVLITLLASCASTPNQSRADQLCGVTQPDQRQRGWVNSSPPQDAGAYRTIAVERFRAPRRDEREYWYRAADGVTRVCVVDARPSGYGSCTGGWTDLQASDSGPEFVDSGEWICVS